jgi:hypothetical protein
MAYSPPGGAAAAAAMPMRCGKCSQTFGFPHGEYHRPRSLDFRAVTSCTAPSNCTPPLLTTRHFHTHAHTLLAGVPSVACPFCGALNTAPSSVGGTGPPLQSVGGGGGGGGGGGANRSVQVRCCDCSLSLFAAVYLLICVITTVHGQCCQRR